MIYIQKKRLRRAELVISNGQEPTETTKVCKQTFPTSLLNAFPTFPKTWTSVVVGKLWDIPRQVFFYCLYHS